MSYLARNQMLSGSLRRACLQTRSFVAHSRLASQGYGDGKGDPKGEKPQDQGPSESTNKEHPGPPPPKAGHGSGSSPTKGDSNASDTSGSSSSQKRQFSTMRTLYAEKKPKSTEGLEPKIFKEAKPNEKEGAPEDVKKHNEDFDKRTDRAHQSSDEKVDSKFWSEDENDRTGGRDSSNA